MKKIIKRIIVFLLILTIFQLLTISVLADGEIILDFYYSSKCESCDEKLILIEKNFEKNDLYSDFLVVNKKDIISNETYYNECYNVSDNCPFPFVIIKNNTFQSDIIWEWNITVEHLNKTINAFLVGNKTSNNYSIIETPFGKINISDLSIPVLTIIISGVDSFNPCAMFILFILLSLLVNTQSRRRMLLIGGIFIFFSGLWYFVFMIGLIKILSLLETMILAIIVGLISILFGVLNLKDFFLYKKGVSLSIPEGRKPGLYKQMRNLIKNPKISGVIFGTILFAATVNLFELVCSIILPLYYTTTLTTMHNLTEMQKILYILFYNIIYVIPLIVILLLFVVTLGRKKLTEWQGQIMKLFSGIMITCFGLIFLYDFKLLMNITTPISILIISIIITIILSNIWKKYQIKKRDFISLESEKESQK